MALNSLRASSPIWVSEVSLARLASLAQMGELARRLGFKQQLNFNRQPTSGLWWPTTAIRQNDINLLILD